MGTKTVAKINALETIQKNCQTQLDELVTRMSTWRRAQIDFCEACDLVVAEKEKLRANGVQNPDFHPDIVKIGQDIQAASQTVKDTGNACRGAWNRLSEMKNDLIRERRAFNEFIENKEAPDSRLGRLASRFKSKDSVPAARTAIAAAHSVMVSVDEILRICEKHNMKYWGNS